MLRFRFLRTAAVALEVYGVLGFVITAALVVVGYTTFSQVSQLQKRLDAERESLVVSIRTVSRTVADTAATTEDFQKSVEGAQAAANTASDMANQTAGTFRQLALGMNLQVLGLQPFVGVSPQFDQSADQLQQLAITLGQTRDALGQNRSDVRRVGNDLGQLQRQLDAVARALDQPGIFGAGQQLLPFQVAFYGMCLLVLLQSIFSVVAGVALYRLQQALGSESLVSVLRRRAPHSSAPQTAPPGPSEAVPL